MAHPIVHFEIYGTDPDALVAYYSALFGWSSTLMSEMNYAVIDTNGGGGINGGITATPDGRTGQSIYVACDDIQASLDKARSLGAEVMMPVMSIPGGPTIAMLGDPAGNYIGLVAPPDAGTEMQLPTKGDGNALAWFEINGGPFEEQRAFYTALFGWEIGSFEGPGFTYGEITNPVDGFGTAGALSTSEDGRTGVTLWAYTDDPQKHLEKAVSLGGTLDMEPATLPDGLTIAMFVDPQGNRFGLFRPPPHDHGDGADHTH